MSLGYCLMDKMKMFRGVCTGAASSRHTQGSTSPDWLTWVDTGWLLPPKSFFQSSVALNKVAKFEVTGRYPPNWFPHLAQHCARRALCHANTQIKRLNLATLTLVADGACGVLPALWLQEKKTIQQGHGQARGERMLFALGVAAPTLLHIGQHLHGN